MAAPLDIIIPTFNNPEYLNPCLKSIIETGALDGLARVIVVNNGKQPIKEQYAQVRNITVIDSPTNLGWEGGLELGLQHSSSPYVVFQNDDTFIPQSSYLFYQRLMVPFYDPDVAAVGPLTTCAAGFQSTFNPRSPRHLIASPFLIFFTVVVRRSHLEEIGGIDRTLPGGDDFDMSIRFRKAGKKLIINPAAFLIHHGFKTGERVRGNPTATGGWNSKEMSDTTNAALIRKHGFKTFMETMHMGLGEAFLPNKDVENEDDIIRAWAMDAKHILELGCGGKKIFPSATGVDRIPAGEQIPFMNMKSVADIVADAGKDIPVPDDSMDLVVAQHIIEHCVDMIGAVQEWKRMLRHGGRLIVATPNEKVTSGIPLNPEHVHAMTPESLRKIMKACGMTEVRTHELNNHISFLACYEKNGSS